MHPFYIDKFFLQPTNVCNLNCTYCYLPDRRMRHFMDPTVSERLAQFIDHKGSVDKASAPPVLLVWHLGEPLATGIQRFETLVRPFENLRRQNRIRHTIQTNATLIDDAWCELLKKYRFSVGVSIDGNETHNASRINWSQSSTFEKTLQGINILKKHHLFASALAVVSDTNIDDPEGFYDFFVEIGASSLVINIEQQEGLNADSLPISFEQSLRFWRNLFEHWRKNPVIRIREFERIINWKKKAQTLPAKPVPMSTMVAGVDYHGNTCILAPEFLSINSIEERRKFMVGNLFDTDFEKALSEADKLWYFQEFNQGRVACYQSCSLFTHCRGIYPSNKYFELGSLTGSETAYCRNSVKALYQVINDGMAVSK